MSKFSEELIGAQLALLFFTASVATYWLLVRKKKRESAEWVPAALVRAYLDRVQADEREIRMKLFGEASPVPYSGQAPLATALASASAPGSSGVADPNLQRELEALRAQLSMADQRAMEFDRMMNAIRAEKAALEQKLKEAQSAGATAAPAAAGADPAAAAAVQKELEDLRAKLQEYEVIEDDLANLKKFQKENEQLRQKVEQYEKGGASAPAVSAASAAAEPVSSIPAAAAAPAASAIAGAASASESSTVVTGGSQAAAPAMTVIPGGGGAQTAPETMIVSGGSAPAAASPAQASPAPAAAAPAPAAQGPEVNTNVLQEVTPTLDSAPAPAAPVAAAPVPAPATEAKAEAQPAEAAAAPAPEKSAEQKEEELLSEFEKMLAS